MRNQGLNRRPCAQEVGAVRKNDVRQWASDGAGKPELKRQVAGEVEESKKLCNGGAEDGKKLIDGVVGWHEGENWPSVGDVDSVRCRTNSCRQAVAGWMRDPRNLEGL